MDNATDQTQLADETSGVAPEPCHDPGLKKGLFVKTYGCQMNEYDTQKMVSLLSSTHHPVASFEEADLVIINTCSVREKAENKLYGLLGTLQDAKKKRPELIIGVSGCVAQQEGHKIVERSSLVDFVAGTHNLSLVPSLVEAVKNGLGPQVAVDYRDEWEDFSDENTKHSSEEQDFGDICISATPVRALVAIQRGCNKNCAFCVVPTTRGPEVSRSPEEIEREVKLKVRLGAKEVLLLGQTVNSFGRDLSPRYGFEKLIQRLATIDGLLRIRFTSPHPAEVRPEFIALYNEVPQLCPHIHLPLQSGSDRILKLMNRNYRTKRYLAIIDSLRQHVPEIAISSDFIVGFPTETEEDFQMTLEMIQRVGYNSSYSFKYSRRPNTQALLEYRQDDEIPEEVAKERLQRLQALQDEICGQLNRKHIGKCVEVLVEGAKKGVSLSETEQTEAREQVIGSRMRGRTAHNVWTELQGEHIATGKLVKVRIEHSSPYGLRGMIAQ